MVVENSLSLDQRHAIEHITGAPGPFFLTGAAGAGKSYIVRYLRRRMDGVVLTAMTGMAAQLIGGTTLHSFIRLHPVRGLLPPDNMEERFRRMQLLVIDEISMANEEIMDLVYRRFRQLSYRGKVLMVGDFMQLPPVDGTPVYDTTWWADNVTTLILEEQHRQHDLDFIEILNEIRMGDLTSRVAAFLHARRVVRLPEDCVHLMARNADVNDENHRRLSMLGKPIQTSYAAIRYNEERRMKMESSEEFRRRMGDRFDWKRVRVPRALHLAEGARVIFLTNSMPRWVNGSTGTVVGVDEEQVAVRMDNGGDVQYVCEHEEEVLDGDLKRFCTVKQFPLMLGWALTIHRAQGATIDRVGVDLEGHFAEGQTYVALSRVRTSDGLFVTGELPELLVNKQARALELTISKAGTYRQHLREQYAPAPEDPDGLLCD